MSVMATTGVEDAVAIRWLLARLRGDTGADGLRNPAAPLATGVHEGLAPQGSALPYVEIIFLAAEEVVATASADEVMAALRFQVKAIVAGADIGPAVAIVRRIHVRLHKQGGVLAGGTAPGEVLSATRRAPIDYLEGAPEATVRHVGAEWRLLVQSA